MPDNLLPKVPVKFHPKVSQWFSNNYPGYESNVADVAREQVKAFEESFPDGTTFSFLFRVGDWWFNTQMCEDHVSIIDVMDYATGLEHAAKIQQATQFENSETIH